LWNAHNIRLEPKAMTRQVRDRVCWAWMLIEKES
jgi:hypothetical protein